MAFPKKGTPEYDAMRAKMAANRAAKKTVGGPPVEAAKEKGLDNEKVIGEPVSNKTNVIVYEPGEGDPHTNVMGGIKFKANVPVTVERTKTILQLLVEKRELKDGTIVTQGVEKRIPLADVLQGNRFFRVDGKRVEVRAGVERVPDDPQTYRGYCQNWMRLANTAKELSDRWDAEHPLREQCGLVESDLAYLRPFYEARHDMLSVA